MKKNITKKQIKKNWAETTHKALLKAISKKK